IGGSCGRRCGRRLGYRLGCRFGREFGSADGTGAGPIEGEFLRIGHRRRVLGHLVERSDDSRLILQFSIIGQLSSCASFMRHGVSRYMNVRGGESVDIAYCAPGWAVGWV